MSETNPSYQSPSVDALTDPRFVVDPNTAIPTYDQSVQHFASQEHVEPEVVQAALQARTNPVEVQVQPETANEKYQKIFLNAFLVVRARDEATGIANVDFPKVNLN